MRYKTLRELVTNGRFEKAFIYIDSLYVEYLSFTDKGKYGVLRQEYVDKPNNFQKGEFAARLLYFLITVIGEKELDSKLKNYDDIKDYKDMINDLLDRYNTRLKKKLVPDAVGGGKAIPEKYCIEFPVSVKDREKIQGIDVPHQIDENCTIDDVINFFKYDPERMTRLAVVGEPGSGKTFLLLKLALFFLDNHIKNRRNPIPVILDLTTWRTADYSLCTPKQSFKLWLESNLPYALGKTGISKQAAKDFYNNKELDKVWLLDGLDEIPEQDRACFNECFNEYMDDRHATKYKGTPEYVICCRSKEFDNLEKAQVAPVVRARLTIKPLTSDKIDEEIDKIGSENSERLKVQLGQDKKQYDKLSTAFGLGISLELAASNEFRLSKIPEGKNKNESLFEVVRYYTEKQVEREELDMFNNGKEKWLIFLAKKLRDSEKGVRFELIDIKKNWLSSPRKFDNLYNAITTVIFGLIGCSVELITQGQGGFYGFLCGSILGFMIFGYAFPYVFNLVFKTNEGLDIYINEIRHFNVRQVTWRRVLGAIPMGFVVGFVFGVFTGAIAALATLSMSNVQSALNVWIYYAAISWGVCGFIVSFCDIFFSIKRNPRIQEPYKRLKNPFLFDFLQWETTLLIITILFHIFYISNYSFSVRYVLLWVYVPILTLAALMIWMVSPIFRHYVLLFAIYCEGNLPLKLVSFLTALEAVGIMEKDGGEWRFRHQLIQDVLHEGLNQNENQ